MIDCTDVCEIVVEKLGEIGLIQTNTVEINHDDVIDALSKVDFIIKEVNDETTDPGIEKEIPKVRRK